MTAQGGKRTAGTALTAPAVICILALVANLLWGSAFSFIKIGYRLYGIDAAATWDQVLFAGCRFTLAGVLVVLFSSIKNRRFMLPRRQAWPKIGCLCLLQTAIHYMLFYIGIARTTGVKASIVDGSSVFFCLLIAGLLFRMEKFTGRKLIGCIVGFAGVVLANLAGTGMTWDLSFTGEGFILLSAVSYAFSSVFLKRFSRDESPVLLSGWQFIIGGVILIAVGYGLGGRIAIHSAVQVVLLLYLAALSAVAFSLWGLLMKYNPVSRIAVYGFMTPVFGVLLASLLLSEENSLTWVTGLALVLVAVGIWIVNRKKTPEEQETDP